MPTTDDVRGLVARVRTGSLVGLVAGPRQQEVLNQVQSTMALIEGHAETDEIANAGGTLGAEYFDSHGIA